MDVDGKIKEQLKAVRKSIYFNLMIGWKLTRVFDVEFGDNVFFVGFLGNFTFANFDEQYIDMFWALMDKAVEENVLTPDYKVHLECQFPGGRTNSPGKYLTDEILKWDRWSIRNNTHTKELEWCEFISA